MMTQTKKLLSSKFVFYSILSLILISNLIIFNFQSNEYESSYCEKFLVGFSDTFTLDEYIEKNPLSIKGDVALIEINLLPDLNSIKCLGSEINLPVKNYSVKSVVGTSYKFIKLTNFLNAASAFVFFLIFNKESKKLFGILMMSNYIVFSNLFFGKLFLDFHLLIYPFTFIIFFFLNSKKEKMNPSQNRLNLFLYLNVVLLIFNYDLYSKLLVFFVIIFIYFFKNIKLNISQINIILFSPIFYYFLRQISGPFMNLTSLWQNLSSGMYRGTPRFADMYYTFAVLNCNKTGCGFNNNYGPLWEFLALKLDVEITSYVFSVLFILISQVFYFSFIKNIETKQILIYFIYISPPTTFLIERMNFDIVVLVLGYFAIKKYQQNYKKFGLIILSLLTLVKIFPIIFLFSIAIYEYLQNNYKHFLKSLFVSLLNILAYVVYFLLDLQTGFIANPKGITWTFGVLSDYGNFIDFFGNLGIFYYFISLGLSILIYIFYLRDDGDENIFSSNEELLELSFLSCFAFIALYFNFDFRISFLSVALILFIKNYDYKKFEIISLIFLTTSVSKYFNINNLTQDPVDFLHSLFYIILNNLTFNIVLIFIGIQVFLYIKKINFSVVSKNLKSSLKKEIFKT
tara:strand:+ start:9654 stop:11534 length:1881 start_codon:yes stop_codon:yes gene_type:complete